MCVCVCVRVSVCVWSEVSFVCAGGEWGWSVSAVRWAGSAEGCGIEIGWRVFYLAETENLQHLDVPAHVCVSVTEREGVRAPNGTGSV